MHLFIEDWQEEYCSSHQKYLHKGLQVVENKGSKKWLTATLLFAIIVV
jgi:hypothetical protein